MANFFNNGGSKDSQICKNIVSETIKYNQISDFILEYKDSYSKRGLIPLFKKIFRNCAGRLNEAKTNYSNALFESIVIDPELNVQLFVQICPPES